MGEPQKVLTPDQMRAVDLATVEAGIPGIVLMENAAHSVVEYIAEKFAPLADQRIAKLGWAPLLDWCIGAVDHLCAASCPRSDVPARPPRSALNQLIGLSQADEPS